MSCAKHIESTKGFTLIEIIMVIVVLGILSAFTFSFIDNAVKTYMTVSKHRMLYQEASYVMERMTRELRDMVNPTLWSNGTTSNTLQFDKSRGTPHDGNTNITFRRDAATNILYRDSGGIARIIGNNVSQLTVTRTSTTVCDRSIILTLMLQDGDQSVTLNSSVTPKNLGTGNFIGRCFNGDYEDIIQ